MSLAPLDNRFVKSDQQPFPNIWEDKTLVVGTLVADAIKFGSTGDTITDYQSFFFTSGFTGCGSFNSTFQFVKIGTQVTMTVQPELNPISIGATGTFVSVNQIPVSVRPAYDMCSIQVGRISQPNPIDEGISMIVDTDGFVSIYNTRVQNNILRVETNFVPTQTLRLPFGLTMSWLTL
jgi:hypothetical protein